MPSRPHLKLDGELRRELLRLNLFVAFAFTVMADPVSSVTYAVESALAAADGDLGDLVPTMALVIATIALVSATYHQLIRRFPGGGGGAEAVSSAFGEGWAFLPIAALIVDFTLTVAVSAAAASSAAIAYVPELADLRLVIATGLAAVVAGLIALGNLGRMAFALATQAFVVVSVIVIVRGFLADPVAAPATGGGSGAPLLGDAGLVAVLLAMPLGMALATGVEAPSNAIAQLGQLGDRGRRLFGQATIWIMVAIVGLLTLSIAALAVRLGIGLPGESSTLIADVADHATGGDGFFAAFQAASAALLLAACASAFAAGSGLLHALAKHGRGDGEGLLPEPFARANRFYVPHWAVACVLVLSLAIILASGAHEQEIVKFYAVAVFVSFFAALVAAVRLSGADGNRWAQTLNLAGVAVIGFVLGLNLIRVDGLVSLGATAVVALYLWRSWVRRGRPGGMSAGPGY